MMFAFLFLNAQMESIDQTKKLTNLVTQVCDISREIMMLEGPLLCAKKRKNKEVNKFR